MDCPRCGLINPDTAWKCDCGYDFRRKKLVPPYRRFLLPARLKNHLFGVAVEHAFWAAEAVRNHDRQMASALILVAALVYPLYLELVKKRKWVRIPLAILTFPFGLMLFGRSVDRYLSEKD